MLRRSLTIDDLRVHHRIIGYFLEQARRLLLMLQAFRSAVLGGIVTDTVVLLRHEGLVYTRPIIQRA